MSLHQLPDDELHGKGAAPDADEAPEELEIESENAPTPTVPILLEDSLLEVELEVAEKELELVQKGLAEVDPLEALDAEISASIQATSAVKLGRKKLATGLLSAAERAGLRQRILEWEAANEWIAEAAVLVVEQQQCICGAQHEHTYGLFERQRSRKPEGGTRWVSWCPQSLTGSIGQLKRELGVIFKKVEVCASCATKQGFLDPTEVNW